MNCIYIKQKTLKSLIKLIIYLHPTYSYQTWDLKLEIRVYFGHVLDGKTTGNPEY
jgi:hypothetical protein